MLAAISSTFSLAMAGRWPAKDAACAKGRGAGTGSRGGMTGDSISSGELHGDSISAGGLDGG